jgi:neutral amino acid transport system permease protein
VLRSCARPLLGLPTLRLRADYLAIVTIAAAEIIRLVARSTTLRNSPAAPFGLNQFAGAFYDLNPFRTDATLRVRPFDFSGNQLFMIVVGWILVALVLLLGVAADAQPVGPGAQGHPRGRGRRPQPSARTSTGTRCRA